MAHKVRSYPIYSKSDGEVLQRVLIPISTSMFKQMALIGKLGHDVDYLAGTKHTWFFGA